MRKSPPTRSPYDRMMGKVTVMENGCWLFNGARDQNGHGNVMVKIDGKKTCRKAHKISYEHHKGPVPRGKVLRHSCDTSNCVAPDHLEPGTQLMNVQDMIIRSRAAFQNGNGSNQYGSYTSVHDACAFNGGIEVEEEPCPF